MNIKTIRLELLEKVQVPELTTSMLLGYLSNYRGPRKEISKLAQKGLIKPIKQGVYIAGKEFKLRPYSIDILGNMIYGPSYISLETALGYYGFIPERVESTTSVCLGNSRSFDTNIGTFEYCHLCSELYPHGITLLEVFDNSFYLHATAEKALFDFIYFREKIKDINNPSEYFNYVVDSYRIDIKLVLAKVSIKKINLLLSFYSLTAPNKNKRILWFFSELVKRAQKKRDRRSTTRP
ncbi:MAG: hypothetical protein HQK53_09265 [Oligoflexia bacterium]|nr:hypothetical protein [Oligoflexia bacterium]